MGSGVTAAPAYGPICKNCDRRLSLITSALRSQDTMGFYNRLLSGNGPINPGVLQHGGVRQQDRMFNLGAFRNGYACGNHRVADFTQDRTPVGDQAIGDLGIGPDVLGRQNRDRGIDRMFAIIKVQSRLLMQQLHIRFIIAFKGAYIFPISLKIIAEEPLPLFQKHGRIFLPKSFSDPGRASSFCKASFRSFHLKI